MTGLGTYDDWRTRAPDDARAPEGDADTVPPPPPSSLSGIAAQVREDLTAIRLHSRLEAFAASGIDIHRHHAALNAAVARIAALMDALEAGQ
jgi:hypothetical protein